LLAVICFLHLASMAGWQVLRNYVGLARESKSEFELGVHGDALM
jgi:hypothetical protein